jgi:hypothetical protein
MRMLLRDIVLFSCLVVFVAGLVIAAATLSRFPHNCILHQRRVPFLLVS